jgi:predicted metal-binding protein
MKIEEGIMKVGIIRCQLTEDMCPGSTDFKVAGEGTLAFAETGPVEIIGFLSCGGCSGKKAVTRAKMMVDRGAEAIVFASCSMHGIHHSQVMVETNSNYSTVFPHQSSTPRRTGRPDRRNRHRRRQPGVGLLVGSFRCNIV